MPEEEVKHSRTVWNIASLVHSLLEVRVIPH